jgi:hypothetical protein
MLACRIPFGKFWPKVPGRGGMDLQSNLKDQGMDASSVHAIQKISSNYGPSGRPLNLSGQSHDLAH